MAQTIGERIREAREARKMSQADLARHMGLSRASISQWESGATAPTRKNYPDLAKLFGWSPTMGGPHPPVSAATSHQNARFVKSYDWGSIFGIQQGSVPAVGEVQVRIDLPEDTFHTHVPDDAMKPVYEGVGGFASGDEILASPSLQPKRGSIVIALLDRDEAPILRQYIPRGNAVDLIATNDEFPAVSINTVSPGRIFGVVVEHRKRLT